MKKSDLEILNKKFIDPLGIGFMCVGCDGSPANAAQTYTYELENIISRGNHERAQIAAEVLLEQGILPAAAADNVVFPTMISIFNRYEAGEINKVEFARAVLAAIKALSSIENEAQRVGASIIKGKIVLIDNSSMESPDTVLAKAVFESLGYETHEATEPELSLLSEIKSYEVIYDFINENKIKLIAISEKAIGEEKAAELVYKFKDSGTDCKTIVWGDNINSSNENKIGCNLYCKELVFGVRILM